ncbi:MAG: hypothetical protein JWP91_3021 [Fibrobacteres bacterium]|nr:hypothetical protein [Fibrobacterota bacterium]
MPIDIGSGAVLQDVEEISIPGRYPLKWTRHYHSTVNTESDSPFGVGWASPYSARLTRQGKEYRFVTPSGGTVLFPDPQDLIDHLGTLRDLKSRHEITRVGSQLLITNWTVNGKLTRYYFQPGRNGQWWPLRSLEDATGQGIELAWDEQGRLKGLRQKLEKRTLAVAYAATGLIASVSFRHADGRQTIMCRYEYDPNGRLSAAFDALGHATRYEYTAEGLLFRELEKDGAVFTYKYDDQGRCIRYGGLDNYNLKVLRYFDHTGWTEVTNSYGKTRRYERLPSGQIIQEIDPSGGFTHTEYDGFFRIRSTTGPMGEKTAYEYDESGNRTRVINALGHETVYEYNDRHLITCEIDPMGGRWERTYDERNRTLSAKDPMGYEYAVEYDQAGNPVQLKKPDGAISRRRFSDNGDLIESSDWEGRLTTLGRDGFGRIVHRRDPDGTTLAFQYDLVGRMTLVADEQGRNDRYDFDAIGNMTRWSSSTAMSVQYRYGTCKRLLEKKAESGAPTKYRWGSEPDRLESVINEKGEIYTFTYDANDRVMRETGFDTGSISFKFDLSGRCIGKTNALGQSVDWQLDAIGQLIGESLPDNEKSSFQYDSLGNVISAENAWAKLAFERDATGRLLTEEQNGFALHRKYDAADQVMSLETDAGIRISYAYDGNGMISSVNANGLGTYEFTRNARSQATAINLPGGMRLEHTYDARGRLLRQAVGDAESSTAKSDPLLERNYAFDDSDLLLSITDGRWGKARYGYNPDQRLIQFASEPMRIEYDLDVSGDPVATVMNGEKRRESSYGPGGMLLTHGDIQYAYDAAGRLVSKSDSKHGNASGKWQYHWDAKDRLRKLTTPEGESWEYEYDPFGRRITKKGPNRNIHFVWDRAVLVHEVEEGQETKTWGFEPGGFKPLFKIQSGNLFSMIRDHLGTPREMVNANGNIEWSIFLDPWGNPIAGTGNLEDCPFRYQGQYFDSESGLHYNNYRYFDPGSGRYISQDPIRLKGGISPYQYVHNPIHWIDPLGLCADKATLKPEAKYLGSKKHGIEWKEGPATANKTGIPQGQWGSKADLAHAGEQAATLKPGEGATFSLPPGSSSVVHLPDGSTVPATQMWVRNNGTGTFHGYPME